MQRFFWKICFCLFSINFSSVGSSAENVESIGVLGDDYALGRWVDSAREWDIHKLWNLLNYPQMLTPTAREQDSLKAFLGTATPLQPPILVDRTFREYRSPVSWFFSLLTQKLSYVIFDDPSFGWGNLVAKKLGVDSTKTYLTAHEHARVGHTTRQIDRLMQVAGGTLPRKIFLQFSLEDLCASSMQTILSVEDYGKALERGLRYFVRNAEPSLHGTEINVAAPLPMMQLLLNPKIQNKKIRAFGEEITCHELRKRNFLPSSQSFSDGLPRESVLLSAFFLSNPATFCPTVFAQPLLAKAEMGVSFLTEKEKEHLLQKKEEEMISILSNRLRLFRKEGQMVVAKTVLWASRAYPHKTFAFRYIDQTADLQWEEEDIASDCIHLSIMGQLKVAAAML